MLAAKYKARAVPAKNRPHRGCLHQIPKAHYSQIMRNEGNEAPLKNQVSLQIYGTSMWPLLRLEDRVILEVPCSPDVQCGEIVLVQQPNGFLLHRIIKIWHENGENYCLTRGDNSLCADQPVTASDVIGRMIALERNGCRIFFDHGLYKVWGRCRGYISYIKLRGFTLARYLCFWVKRFLGLSCVTSE